LLGVGILGLSIYLYVDSNYYVVNVDSSELYNTPIFVLMALGAIMTLVGFLGCCANFTFFSLKYIFLCITMGVACGVAVYWANTHEELVKERVQKDFQNMIKERYLKGGKSATEYLIDRVQKDFQCCGAKGVEDWSSSRYQQGNKSKIDIGVSKETHGTFEVPASCCSTERNCDRNRREVTFDSNSKLKATGINREGCSEKVKKFVDEKWQLIITVGVVVAVVQLFALIFAFCLCCALCCFDSRMK
ncbi:CD81 antigen-like protein, partial [Dinothrombium tinctorium]